MKELCFATNNEHKLTEARYILRSKIKVASLADINCTDELEETQATIEGNSLQKAKFVFDTFGIPCFADDTGLEVEALAGAPGVFSARYAGMQKKDEDNIQLLLKNLENKKNREAQFRTVITMMDATGTYIFEGILKGTILTHKTGAHGFGYDSIFVPQDYVKSLAEMPAEQKNTISHRAIAMNKLTSFLLK